MTGVIAKHQAHKSTNASIVLPLPSPDQRKAWRNTQKRLCILTKNPSHSWNQTPIPQDLLRVSQCSNIQTSEKGHSCFFFSRHQIPHLCQENTARGWTRRFASGWLRVNTRAQISKIPFFYMESTCHIVVHSLSWLHFLSPCGLGRGDLFRRGKGRDWAVTTFPEQERLCVLKTESFSSFKWGDSSCWHPGCMAISLMLR